MILNPSSLVIPRNDARPKALALANCGLWPTNDAD